MRPRFGLNVALAVAAAVLVTSLVAAFLWDLDTLILDRFGVWERNALIAVGLFAIVIVLVATARQNPAAFLATLFGTALWVPWIAALASSALYLASGANAFLQSNAVLIGIGVAAILWLLYAALDRDFATPRRQSPGWVGLLQHSVNLLKVRAQDDQRSPCLPLAQEQALRSQVTNTLEDVEAELCDPGLRWVTRAGFNTVWSTYHRADEAMVLIAPIESVIDVAVADILRLNGASIDSRLALQTGIRKAVAELDPDAESYIAALIAVNPKDPVCPESKIDNDPKPVATAGAQAAVKPAATKELVEPDWCSRLIACLLALAGRAPADPKPAEEALRKPATDQCVEERRARSMIQAFHRAINTYRGTQWAELGRARWQLMLTTTIAGAVAFLVLSLALIRNVETSLLVAGWAFFLIGAAAGLFLRLRLASEEDQVSDDYGLEAARLYQTPLLSGMAAVIGVILMASIAGSNLGQVLEPQPLAVAAASPSADASATPSAAPSASAAPAPSEAPPNAQSTESSLTAAFDLGRYPLGIVIALIFGLTPNLVLRRLGLSASEAKKELLATRPA